MRLAMQAGAAIRSQQAAITREGEQAGNGQNWVANNNAVPEAVLMGSTWHSKWYGGSGTMRAKTAIIPTIIGVAGIIASVSIRMLGEENLIC